MATDPLKKDLNRALQIKQDSNEQNISIKLIDVDRAIMEHVEDTVLPQLVIQDEVQLVPLLYGSAERWKSIQKDGFLRDRNGALNIPLVVLKRSSVEANDSMANPLNRQVSYPSVSQYSPKHKYDLFSKMSGFTKPKEQYNIAIPDYVIATYDFIVWTNFTEHMNTILEAFQFATDTYWGDKYGFKFLSKISSFDTSQEMAEGEQRMIKTTFSLTVNAYLLPEKFDNRPTTQKAFTVKKVIWNIDTYDTATTTASQFKTKTPGTETNYRDEYYRLVALLESASGSYDGGRADTW